VPLVKKLATGGESAAKSLDNSWVAVCRLHDGLSKEMVRDLLDSNNIPSMVTSSVFQPLGNGAGWVTRRQTSESEKEIVMVPREFTDEAELMLSAVLGDDFEFMDMRE
jgi:hypothetical protein